MQGTVKFENPLDQKLCKFASEVQDAVNLLAISTRFAELLKEMRTAGMDGDTINNHPIVVCFASKLNSLCRLTAEREMKAFAVLDDILTWKRDATYEIIPL